MVKKIDRTDAEWREMLTPEEYDVCRHKGTERPFTGEYNDSKVAGSYACRGCGQELFSSKTKFDSGSGWPSFWKPVDDDSVGLNIDAAHGMIRTEVVCSRCDTHLGHVFDDGPKPTGQRYCINSLSLQLVEDETSD